ncbi:hypothetical protein [Rhodococcus sp. JS3073]|uniref:hypothetical protein n=1 Tax=Rhodococcus sp. JS3073 TaxID=3002901 RepID=UPI0022864376|nr:hypothetical protein [Rhodococcus sp. JS3073]WAM13939.1 hypothetical protein OYT95_31635 [Rhodococcus sp. JS3073]
MDDHFTVPTRIMDTLIDAQDIATAMHELELLDSNESDTVNVHIERAHAAEQAAREAGAAFTAARRQIGIDVAEGKTKPGDIAEETLKLADPSNVYRAAEAAYTESARRAYRAALVNADRAPDVLNARLAHLAERASELAPQLVGITTADGALAAGRGEAWLEVADLKATHSRLREIAHILREAGVMEKQKPGAGGVHWQFRADPKQTEIGVRADWRTPVNNLPDGGRLRFLAEMSAEPYTPATEAEAEEVRRAHDTAAVVRQAERHGRA